MSEQHGEEQHTPDDVGGQDRHAASERTGLPAVDAVLDQVEAVGDLPVADQVAIFESAHDELRRALDAGPAQGL